MLPDVVVQIKSAAIPRTLPSDTGVAFAVGLTERGSKVQPRLCRSLDDFQTYFGARLSSPIDTTLIYDWADAYFGEGGAKLYVSRAWGEGAVTATRNLLDTDSAVSLVVKAGQYGDEDPGTWGNSLKIAVLSVSGGFQIQTVRTINAVDVIEETSPVLVTQADAIAWSKASSGFVVISLGATAKVPVALSAASLSTGTDGAALDDDDFDEAASRIPPDLGPGQLCFPGQTTTARGLILIAQALANHRFALCDLVDSGSASTLAAAATALYAAPNSGRRWAQAAAPWDVIPGLTAGSTRTVPPSARLAAQYARVDALGNPNQAAAGRYGEAQYVVDLSQAAWTDADRKTLNDAGVTVSRRRYGSTIVTWGMRTLADQINDENWSMSPNVRCVMAYAARGKAMMDRHEFDQVDGFGHMLGEVKGDLIGLAGAFFVNGSLYGATPAEAFSVDTSSAVNSPEDLAAGQVTAQVALRTSPSAEAIVLNIVKVPITLSV